MTRPWPSVLRPTFFILLGVIGGCTGQEHRTHLSIAAGDYAVAFEQACLATQEAGMPPLVRDPVGGVIQGRPRLAGSLIEPWRIDQASFSGAVANTLNKQRRRVRVEFLPIDFRAPEPTGQGLLLGAVVPGSTIDEARSIDLLNHDGEIEVRVWVYIEREFIANLQRSTWTRVGKVYARDPVAAERPRDGTTRSVSRWTPIGRDEVMERALLGDIAAGINASSQ